MDSERFDRLARSLGARHNRRSVVKSFGAAALGAAGVMGLRGVVTAAPKDKVNICHATGNGTYNYISVSSNALPAHTAHGDVVTNLDDLANCRACGNACIAPANGAAFCGEDGCVFTCDEGYVPDDNGACIMPSTGCANALLSGPGRTLFCVDDEIRVYVNGISVFEDLGTSACFHTPVSLGPVQNGDQIQVVANNSDNTCGEVSLLPIYLSCEGGSVEQTLDAVGFPGDPNYRPECGFIFYDRTFTVAL